jgi:hypothetical protein
MPLDLINITILTPPYSTLFVSHMSETELYTPLLNSVV